MKFQSLASQIAGDEGLKKPVSIGNIREVLRLTLTKLSKLSVVELGELLKKYQKRGR